MHKIPALFFAFALICSMAAAPARAAAPISESGAAALKKLVENEIQWRHDLAEVSGQGITAAGPVEVVPKGSFYEVKISQLSAAFGPDRNVTIGTVMINAVPNDHDTWLLNISIPSSVTLADATTPLARINIGAQQFTSTWIPAKGIYPVSSALYRDIKITTLDKNALQGTIGTVKMSSALKDNGDNTWSGPTGFEAADIDIEAAQSESDTVQVKVGKVAAESIYDRLDLTKSIDAKKKIQTLPRLTAPSGDKKASLSADSQGLFDSMKSNFSASNVAIHQKAAKPAPGAKEKGTANKDITDISLANISFQGNLQKAREEKGTAQFKTSFDGLKTLPKTDLAGVTPENLSIEVHVENIPARAITGMIFNSLQNTPADPAGGFATLPEVLLGSGITLAVQNSFIKSPDLYTTLTGKMGADPASVAGLTGKLAISIQGLENAASKLQTLGIKPGADPQTLSYAGSLTAIMLMGREGKAPTGEATSDYLFEITQDGKIMLNGVNMQSLMKAGEVLNRSLNRADPPAPKKAP